MTWVDIFGHIGFAFLLLGKIAVIHKHRWGFIAWAVGAGIWTVLGWYIGLGSLVIWNLIYIGMYTYGYLKWSGDDKGFLR